MTITIFLGSAVPRPNMAPLLGRETASGVVMESAGSDAPINNSDGRGGTSLNVLRIS